MAASSGLMLRDISKLALLGALWLIIVLLTMLSLALEPLRRRGRVQSSDKRTDKRFILISPFAPGSESGGAKAVQDLLTALRGHNHATWIVPKRARENRIRGAIASVLLRALPIPDACRRMAFGYAPLRLATAGADIVVFEFFATATYLWLGRLRAARIVVRDHEVLLRKLAMEMRPARGVQRLIGAVRWGTCYAVSLVIYRRADCIVTLTEQDRLAIIRWFPRLHERIVHIPAPFEAAQAISPHIRSNDPVRDLLMVGNFFHSPNVDALMWFLRDCAPHLVPGFTLHICGLDKPLDGLNLNAAGLNIVRHGFVEDPAMMAGLAPIAIAPIVSGGGVRIKNLYLASMGKALVTTPLGNEGIGFVDGMQAIICQNARAMAEQINALSRDPSRIALLGVAARDYVKESFRPDAILAKLDAALYGTPASNEPIQSKSGHT